MSREAIVVVGTESALKHRAVLEAFLSRGFEIELRACHVPSGVSDQPIGLDEMYEGAHNRARAILEAYVDASISDIDFAIGIENGLVEQGGSWFDAACVVIIDDDDTVSTAYSAFFPIPEWAVQRVIEDGTELGVLVRELVGDRAMDKDVMAYFSGGSAKREELLATAVSLALIPYLETERYEKPREAIGSP